MPKKLFAGIAELKIVNRLAIFCSNNHIARVHGCPVLRPKGPDEVWHTDITEMRVLWKKFEIAAVLVCRPEPMMSERRGVHDHQTV